MLGRRATTALLTVMVAAGGVGVALAVAGSHEHHRVAAPVAPVNPGAATRLAEPPTPTPSPSSTPRPAPRTTRPSTAARPTPTHAHPTSAAAPPDASRPSVPSDGGPIGISAPAAHISAPVVPIGVTSDGEVDIPENIRIVGWYRYSQPPGSASGSTVLVGHVDSAVQGLGAFFTLRELGAGDRITLDMPGGRHKYYRVVSRQEYPKTNVPLAALFSTGGQARLTLITCGGAFDTAARSYLDNVVITAVPA